MLRPSYSELMQVLNDDQGLDNQITSRYTIVIAAAKRARQIVSGAQCDKADAALTTDKAVSIAVSGLVRGLINLYPEGLPEDEEGYAVAIAAAEALAEETAKAELEKMNKDIEINFDEDEDDIEEGME